MFEPLTKFVDFVAAYPGWVKYTLVALTVAILLLLIVFRPQLAAPVVSKWKVQVYHFENFGTAVNEQHLGERFSGLILDHLLSLDLEARRAEVEPPYFLGFSGIRGLPPTSAGQEYRQLAPCILVAGYVEDAGSASFQAHVRATAIDRDLQIHNLMLVVHVVETDHDTMRSKAQSVANTIYQAAREVTVADPGSAGL